MARRRTPGLAFVSVGVVLFGVGAAQAEPPTVALSWKAPGGCPSRQDVVTEFTHLLDLGKGQPAPVAAAADVEELGEGRFRTSLRFASRGQEAAREFDSESCAAAAAAVALILAVSAQDDQAQSTAAPPVAVSAPPPSSDVAARPAALDSSLNVVTTAPAGPKNAGTSNLVAGLSAVVDAGLMPGAPAAGLEAALGWSHAFARWRLRVTAAGAMFTPGIIEVEGAGFQAERFALWAGSARACVSRTFRRVEIGPCLGLEVERMTASGVGSQPAFEAARGSAAWAAGLAGAAAHIPLTGRLAIQLRTEGVLSPVGQRFILRPDGLLVHQTPRLAARISVGLELRFF